MISHRRGKAASCRAASCASIISRSYCAGFSKARRLAGKARNGWLRADLRSGKKSDCSVKSDRQQQAIAKPRAHFLEKPGAEGNNSKAKTRMGMKPKKNP